MAELSKLPKEIGTELEKEMKGAIKRVMTFLDKEMVRATDKQAVKNTQQNIQAQQSLWFPPYLNSKTAYNAPQKTKEDIDQSSKRVTVANKKLEKIIEQRKRRDLKLAIISGLVLLLVISSLSSSMRFLFLLSS